MNTRIYNAILFEKSCACEVTTSPINRIPPELLERIIWLSAAEESMPQYHYYALSHVDRFWRQTIVENFRFWTSLDLQWPLEVVETILNRSGLISELSFRLTGNASALPPFQKEFIQRILVSQSHRVQTLHITIDSSITKKLSGISFPNLKNVILNDFPSEEEDDLQVSFLNNAPNLQTLDISKCRVDLPWDQLYNALCRIRQLKIRFNSRDSYTNFLSSTSSFTNLQDLSVESLYGIDIDPEYEPRDPNARMLRYPTHAFTLPNLQTLRVHSLNMPTLMTRLHTPSLRQYEVRTQKYGTSHVLRRYLHPILEEFDYSTMTSLYVGFHAPCSGICVWGSEEESSPDFSLFESDHWMDHDHGTKGFHIQLFRPATVEAFLLKGLTLLFPRLTNLKQLLLQFHNVSEVSETKTLLILHLLKYKPNRCPNLETILCRFPGSPPLCETSDVMLGILRTRLEYGFDKLKYICLENYPVDEDFAREARELGVTVAFSAPLHIC